MVRLFALPLVAVALLLAACNTGPNASQSLSLSVANRSPSSASGSISANIQIGSGANSLTISQAQVVLKRIELASSSACDTTGEEDDDCGELHAGPTLVDLPVDGTTKVILDAAVPAGTYQGLEAKLAPVDSDDAKHGGAAFLAAHPDFKGISVKVTGVFTDSNSQTHSFTLTLGASAEIEAHFTPSVTVGSGTSNLTVVVDVGSWFKNGSGGAIDPTNAMNAGVIERNIRQSFRAFEDDNHDGMDDHDENGGGGGEHDDAERPS